jgi:hypothetical protein
MPEEPPPITNSEAREAGKLLGEWMRNASEHMQEFGLGIREGAGTPPRWHTRHITAILYGILLFAVLAGFWVGWVVGVIVEHHQG